LKKPAQSSRFPASRRSHHEPEEAVDDEQRQPGHNEIDHPIFIWSFGFIGLRCMVDEQGHDFAEKKTLPGAQPKTKV
jgi:hypothetical protein